MVSIIAEDVYDETVNFNVNDGVLIESAFGSITYPTVNANTVIDGFAYIETVIVEVTLSQLTYEVFSGGGFDRDVRIEAKPSYVFDGKLDLLEAVPFQLIAEEFAGNGFEQVVTVGPVSGSATIALDSYIDLPAVTSIDIEISGANDIEIEGNQSGTIEASTAFIGRAP